MGSIIYYFSATGNSLTIARKIAEKLGDCTVQSMALEPPNEPVGGPEDSIGFVFPVYFMGMPRIVKSFVQKLNIIKGTYCYALINYGGSRADTSGMLEDILKEKGVELSYASGVKMPGNYTVMYSAAAPEAAQNLIKNAMAKVAEAADDIVRRRRLPVKRNVRLLSKMVNQSLYKDIAHWDEKFKANDKCNGCGLCAKVCPVSNIKLEDRRPHWQHHCERCLACLQWCPQEAIEYGKKTVGRRRYHNPTIDVQDIVKGGK